MLFSNIHWKVLYPAEREEAWNFKTSLNGDSYIFLFESIEEWSKKQDKTSKQTSDHQTNQYWIEADADIIYQEASVTS